MKDEAREFAATLGLEDDDLDPRYDRCYCAECYKGPGLITNEGPHPYAVPHGWFRLGLKIKKRLLKPEIGFFKTWSTSFHGVKSTAVLKSVLDCGGLLKPGDRLMDGSKLKSTKCAGRQDKDFYTSPSIRCAEQ